MAGTAAAAARTALRQRGRPVLVVAVLSVLVLLVPRWVDRDPVRLDSLVSTLTDVSVGETLHVGVLPRRPIAPSAARVLVEPTLAAAAGVAVCERREGTGVLGSGYGTDLRDHCASIASVSGQSIDPATSYLVVTIVPTAAGRGRVVLEIDGAADLVVGEIDVG